MNLGDVMKKHLCFLKALHHIKRFYAVKCNSSKGVVQTPAYLGAGFDCASKAEIALVQCIVIPPDKIIYTNPCKQILQIKYAANQGVQLMAFDNEVEPGKTARSLPHARMVLCITTDNSGSSGHLSMKYGATLQSCRHLLETAKEMNVEIIGISFHVGSGGIDPQTFIQSIADAWLVFEMGAELGYRIHLLDMGGGFPGTDNSKVQFEKIAAMINSALDLYFPEGCGVEIIAEPGRYYIASIFTLTVNVTDKQEIPLDRPGSDETLPRLAFVQQHPLGPSCDGQDHIVDGLELPELQIGNWLTFENIGAYTIAASSMFNRYQQPQINYAMSRMAWEAVQLFQRKLPQLEEDRENMCTLLSCDWEITDTS